MSELNHYGCIGIHGIKLRHHYENDSYSQWIMSRDYGWIILGMFCLLTPSETPSVKVRQNLPSAIAEKEQIHYTRDFSGFFCSNKVIFVSITVQIIDFSALKNSVKLTQISKIFWLTQNVMLGNIMLENFVLLL